MAASSFVIYLAVYFWWGGHISCLILKGRKLPDWVIKQIDTPKNPLSKQIKETKPYHAYVSKGIGWGIILFFATIWLFEYPSRRVLPHKPVVGNITLAYIGEVAFVVIMFLISIYSADENKRAIVAKSDKMPKVKACLDETN